MRLAHLLVLHGPHLDLLGEAPFQKHPTLAAIDRALELAASTSVAGVRSAQGYTEGELVSALHRARDWATHVLVSPGALAPTAWVLREALAIAALPFGEVFVDALPHAAEHAKKSLLRHDAAFQKRGPAPGVYLDAAQKLLGVTFLSTDLTRVSAATPPPRSPRADAKIEKVIGRKAPAALAAHRVPKTLGRAPPRAEPPPQRNTGINRAAVRSQVSARLSGRISPAELATWAREQWLAVERGAATESGQRELLAEALQALALSAAPGLTLSDPELLDWMAKMG